MSAPTERYGKTSPYYKGDKIPKKGHVKQMRNGVLVSENMPNLYTSKYYELI